MIYITATISRSNEIFGTDGRYPNIWRRGLSDIPAVCASSLLEFWQSEFLIVDRTQVR